MLLTAKDVFDKLINEEKILEINGQIKFHLGTVNIIVKQRDVVGNIMQEWLEGWLKQNKIVYEVNQNTQMPPDFYLNPKNKTIELLEIKAFNFSASPGFDIADFNAFQSEIIKQPYMLHAYYLIFGYEMQEDGFVIIKNLWLKNVWEICRRMENWPINLQVKDKVVHKIRPCVWYAEGKLVKYTPFKSLEHFISAIEQTVYQNPKTRELSSLWLTHFLKSYNSHYGKKLVIPRWSEIENDYIIKK